MRFIPHDYQAYAIKRCLDQPTCGLFLDMGLGKTVITLTAIVELMCERFDVARTLVIAPLRVAQMTWAQEAAKWDHTKHLRISKVLGSEEERLAALRTPADVYVINRENVVWLVNRCWKRWPFDLVVIDELSSFKSTDANRFRALRYVRPQIKRMIGLTGTPAPNGLIDLWPQIYLLDGGARLGNTVTGYRNRYFRRGRYNPDTHVVYSWEPKPEAERAIYSKLQDLCVSMRAEDWIDVPERVDIEVPVELSPTALERYRQLERDLLLPLADDAIAVAGSAAALSNKLLQMANGAVYDEDGAAHLIHDEKLDALEELTEAANGKPLLVFYAYRHDLARLKTRFPWARALRTTEDLALWNAGKVPMMLAHPASAGHGLNMQEGGNQIVWFGLTWSLELYQQANARLHRQGQKERVIVHHIIAKGTIDEDVVTRLADKDATQDDLLNALRARVDQVRGVAA